MNELVFFTKLPHSSNKRNLRKIHRIFYSKNGMQNAEITVNKSELTCFLDGD